MTRPGRRSLPARAGVRVARCATACLGETLAVLALVVGAASACPGQPGCNGDASSTLSVAGKACTDCTVDFGAVDVGLQEHRRIDAFWGCGFGAPSFQQPSQQPSNAVFTIDLQALTLPQQQGATGFLEVTFTPADATDQTDSLDLGNGFKAALHGKGVTP